MPPHVIEWTVIVYAIINLYSAPYIFRLFMDDSLYMKDITVGQILIVAFNAPVYMLLCFITFMIAASITVKDIMYKTYNTITRILSWKPFARKG